MVRLRGGELLCGPAGLQILFLKHMAERIQQEIDKKEKERVTDKEGGQPARRIDDNAQDLHCGFGRVLQNIPGVEPYKTAHVHAETAQRRYCENERPVNETTERTLNDI